MPKLSVDNVNPDVVNAVFVVRGKVQEEAEKLEQQLQGNSGADLPFDQLIYCNIGNPQAQSQKPITFLRHILSIMDSPDLLLPQNRQILVNGGIFTDEEMDRASQMLSQMNALPLELRESGKKVANVSSTGAYTGSQGLPFVRQHVCDFIRDRDGLGDRFDVAHHMKRVFMTDGAGAAVKYILQLLIRPGQNDSIMIPLPQYPLYSAGITLYGGKQAGYYLNESQQWQLSVEELNRVYEESEKSGEHVRALVVINPGNPTGSVLSRDNMIAIVKFCVEKRIVLLADEVYQDNMYHDDESKSFISFNRVMYELNLENELELISFHSASKGYLGECGRRGGYVHIGQAIDDGVLAQLVKLVSVILAPNTHGQLAMDILIHPPKSNGPSAQLFNQEKDSIIQSLKRRAKLVSDTFNSLPGIECQPINGAMYAFPKIMIPEKAVQEAQKQGLAPDLFYVLEMLNQTGVVCVPGGGFGQEKGTFHFRTTFLPQEHELKKALDLFKVFHTKFIQQYSE